jgi:hypothetical protein
VTGIETAPFASRRAPLIAVGVGAAVVVVPAAVAVVAVEAGLDAGSAAVVEVVGRICGTVSAAPRRSGSGARGR